MNNKNTSSHFHPAIDYSSQTRRNQIVFACTVGIVTNLLLAAFKIYEAIVVRSSSMFTDGVNNITGALTSTISLVAILLAYKKPDKSHPMGYGRVEYLSATFICITVVYAGISSLRGAITTIVDGSHPTYNTASFVILLVSVIAKILLGIFNHKMGVKVSSNALIASGAKAYMGAALSLVTLAGAILSTYLSSDSSWIDGGISLLLAAFIFYTGITKLLKTLNAIIGTGADSTLAASIREIASEQPGIKSVGDIFIDNYGPFKNIGFMHVEVDKNMTAGEFDKLAHVLAHEIFHKFRIPMSIGLYTNPEEGSMEAEHGRQIAEKLKSYPEVLNIHGYRENPERKRVRIDVILSFDVENVPEMIEILEKETEKILPGYHIEIVPNLDLEY